MALPTTIQKIKQYLRISHSALDEELNDEIEACLADLRLCGVSADEYDENVLAALKLYCKANISEDMAVAEAFRKRYEDKKKCLMMAEGYGA